MDHTPREEGGGVRRRAPGGGLMGTATQGTRSSPAPTFRRNAAVPRRKLRGTREETPRHSGKRRGTWVGKRAVPAGRETPRPLCGNAWHRGRETRGGHAGNAHRPAGANAAGYRPLGGSAAGQRPLQRNVQRAGDPLLISGRAACPASAPRVGPLSPRTGETVRGA